MVSLTNDTTKFTIMSDCNSVHVLSTKALKKTDIIIVGNRTYKGGNTQINQVVATNFTISMESHSPTSVRFSCTQWGAWEAFGDDGTCRSFQMRPLLNWKNTKGLLRYKLNETCGKFRQHFS